ncbi:MAG: type II toxin-antitoxin system YoeB family toxin [Oscillospiraceae bacterium]|jgi:toxin YoeB|nr:type II toxin-antitoxin system YoeB family toxin [Oscillospiraceae bacterium]
MRIIFTEKALAAYTAWHISNKKMVRWINALIVSIERDGFTFGRGKPEVVKGRRAYSRRIDNDNRLVYTDDGYGNLIITSCKGKYYE